MTLPAVHGTVAPSCRQQHQGRGIVEQRTSHPGLLSRLLTRVTGFLRQLLAPNPNGATEDRKMLPGRVRVTLTMKLPLML